MNKTTKPIKTILKYNMAPTYEESTNPEKILTKSAKRRMKDKKRNLKKALIGGM